MRGQQKSYCWKYHFILVKLASYVATDAILYLFTANFQVFCLQSLALSCLVYVWLAIVIQTGTEKTNSQAKSVPARLRTDIGITKYLKWKTLYYL